MLSKSKKLKKVKAVDSDVVDPAEDQRIIEAVTENDDVFDFVTPSGAGGYRCDRCSHRVDNNSKECGEPKERLCEVKSVGLFCKSCFEKDAEQIAEDITKTADKYEWRHHETCSAKSKHFLAAIKVLVERWKARKG